MVQFVARRLLALIPVMLGVSLLVFSMLHLVPGDPVMTMMAQGGASVEQIERLRGELGLNRPLHMQYLTFVSNAAKGDLGRSLRTHQPVTSELAGQIRPTVELAVTATLIAVSLGLILGTLAAYYHNTWIDSAAMVTAVLGVSIPSFWLGLMLLYIFSVTLGWIPVTSSGGPKALILPALTLGLIFAAPIARMARSACLDVFGQDYVRTARAKGLTEFAVVFHHALRNALIPVISLIGIQFGTLLAGTVVVETVFARRGLGHLLVTAILERDYPLVQGIVLLMATVFVVTNMFVDLIQAWIDPRMLH